MFDKERIRDLTYESHKAIVSAELFEKVQNVIKLKQEKALPKKIYRICRLMENRIISMLD